jgi:5-methylcytosine-specific restriction endonuclease McrA
MPCDYKIYPKDWQEIRKRILIRAKNKCEFCKAENHKPHPLTKSIVVLTIMHLDHDPENHEIKDSRLRAACQRCHLNFDRLERWYKKKDAEDQLYISENIFEEEI